MVALWELQRVVAPWGHFGDTPWGRGGTGSGHAVGLLLGSLAEDGAGEEGTGVSPNPPPRGPRCHPPGVTPQTWATLTPVRASTAAGRRVTTSRISPGSRDTPMSPEPPATSVTRRVPSSGCATASATWPKNAGFQPKTCLRHHVSLPANPAVPNPARFGPVIPVGRPPNALASLVVSVTLPKFLLFHPKIHCGKPKSLSGHSLTDHCPKSLGFHPKTHRTHP